jgi:spore coat polysaccharide biosynthesis predicted glycosyltransferase SpsG
MAESHIAITALGTTPYELVAVGVPAIIISNYEEAIQDMETYKKLGVHVPLGYYDSVRPEMIKNAVKDFLSDQNHWEMMRNKGWEIIDGNGAERIARLLCNLTL